MSLVDELKAEHRVLLAQLKAAQKISFDRAALEKALLEAKEVLFAHLGKEDARYYGPLLRAARQDSRLDAILRLFREDMELLTKQVLDFYARIDAQQFGDDFEEAFKALATRLRSRISKEESFLYSEYSRLGLE